MSRRVATQIATLAGRGEKGRSTVFALCNDGTIWEIAQGGKEWIPCVAIPQGEWGKTGTEPAEPPRLGPDEWGSPAPPERTEVA